MRFSQMQIQASTLSIFQSAPPSLSPELPQHMGFFRFRQHSLVEASLSLSFSYPIALHWQEGQAHLSCDSSAANSDLTFSWAHGEGWESAACQPVPSFHLLFLCRLPFPPPNKVIFKTCFLYSVLSRLQHWPHTCAPSLPKRYECGRLVARLQGLSRQVVTQFFCKTTECLFFGAVPPRLISMFFLCEAKTNPSHSTCSLQIKGACLPRC